MLQTWTAALAARAESLEDVAAVRTRLRGKTEPLLGSATEKIK
jgi:hypothetical protein